MPNKEPGAGEAARYRSREKGEGLSTVEAGRCPKPGAVEEAEPPGEAGEGPGPCPAHPPTRPWQRLAVCKPGAVQGAGLSPSSDQTLTSLSPLTPTGGHLPSHSSAKPSPLSPADFWGHKFCLPAAFPTLTPATLSRLTFLDSFKTKTKTKSPCHGPSTVRDTAQVLWRCHPTQVHGHPPCLCMCPAPLMHPTLKPMRACSAPLSLWATVTGQVSRQAGTLTDSTTLPSTDQSWRPGRV